MKKIHLSILFIIAVTLSFGQTTATDFTVDDCSGTSHNLFDELDNGKIIVIAWPMPCFTCIAPTIAAHDAANSFDSSNPGVVEFYCVDDIADTDCGTLSAWGTANGLTGVDAYFSNADINMTDYGVAGMPKVVVLGCTDHKIFFNKNDNISYSQVQGSIASAISGTGCTTGINNNEEESESLSIFPNPGNNVLNISYSLDASSEVTIEIYSNTGALVQSINQGQQNSGKISQQLDIDDLSEGVYFIKLLTETFVQTERLIVSR